MPGAFVVDLLEDTGRMDRGEAELLLSWFEWVEVEALGCPALLEGLCRLRGAVKAARFTWIHVRTSSDHDILSVRDKCPESVAVDWIDRRYQ